jgi:hypothetical protein
MISTFTCNIRKLSELPPTSPAKHIQFLVYSPGYPDTERFKFLKSVSIQSRNCQEDERKNTCAAFGILLGQGRIGKSMINRKPFFPWSPALVNCFSPEGKKQIIQITMHLLYMKIYKYVGDGAEFSSFINKVHSSEFQYIPVASHARVPRRSLVGLTFFAA